MICMFKARFTKSSTDESLKKKRQSFQSIEQKLAEEPWIEVDYQQPTVIDPSQSIVFIFTACSQ